MKKKTVEKFSGIKEIARRGNVSIATVDRVIHKRSGVSPKTQEKINRIIKELDYQPNLLARRLASRKVIRLASLIPKISEETSFWDAPLSGIHQAEAELKQFGITVEKRFFDQNDKRSFVKESKAILKSKPDGVLLAPSFIEESIAFIRECGELGIPYVFINSDIPGQGSLCYIGPDLYRSGYLAGNLASYLVGEDDEVLVVNISRELDNRHHLLRKEEGFRAYFADHNKKSKICKVDIRQVDNASLEKALDAILKENKKISLIFVTNSRVSAVAQYMKKTGSKLLLVGYDFLKENINYLDEGIIDFLICQKPVEQAYRGIMALYQKLVLSVDVEEIYFMPIDIITKENYSFYRN